jgi:hypothetical protein
MPLLRYFVYVGVSLLGLLLITNAALTPIPLPGTLTSATDLPSVRIRSEQKLPDAVVFDTRSTISTAPVRMLPAPAAVAQAAAPAESAATVTEISPKARVREAFAQLPDAAKSAATGPKAVAKPQVKRRVVARPRSAYPYMVAQQPHFNPFATW